MGKAIKLKDDMYIDSSSIIHKEDNTRNSLKDLLNNKIKVLYKGRSPSPNALNEDISIILNDNVKNYDVVEVIVGNGRC